eukprot:g261.t1
MGLCHSKEPSVKDEEIKGVCCFKLKSHRKRNTSYPNNDFCIQPQKKELNSTLHDFSTIPVGTNDRPQSCYSPITITHSTDSAESSTERDSLEDPIGFDLVASLRSSTVFKDLDEELIGKVTSVMKQRSFYDGDIIIQRGQLPKNADCIYCVARGEVTLLVSDTQVDKCDAIMKGLGWVFGESSLVFNAQSNVTVIAHGGVRVYTLSKIDFLNLMQNTPKIRLLKFLRKLPFLKTIPDDQLIEFGDVVKIMKFNKGDPVLDQSCQKNSCFYIIRKGTISITHKGSGNASLKDSGVQKGDELRRGHFFGLDEEIQTNYYALSSPTEVLIIKHEDCQKLNNVSIYWKLIEDSLTTVLNDLGSVNIGSLRLGDIADQKYMKEAEEGDMVLEEGQEIKDLFLVVTGSVVACSSENSESSSSNCIKSLHGICYFGEDWNKPSTANGSIVVTSNRLQYLQIPHRLLKQADDNESSETSSQVPEVSERVLNAFSVEQENKENEIEFHQLKQYRVVGEGQYGKVRLVTHEKTGKHFALKIIQKSAVKDIKTVEHIIMERKVLSTLSGKNFLVGFQGAFQDNHALYLLMDWIPGGELFSRITTNGMLAESHAVFYAANVVLAFNTMHRMNIIYRDLKPENILIDRNGYLRLSDYGFATIADSTALTLCGTPDYQAPEIILRKGARKASDYWALGILIFEMLTGDAPFKALTDDPLDTYRLIVSGKFHIPRFVSSAAADLITKLLQVDPKKRLGYQSADEESIKSHPWFKGVHWDKLENQKTRAPFVPHLSNSLDTSCFDQYDNSTCKTLPLPNRNFFTKDHDWSKLWCWVDDF